MRLISRTLKVTFSKLRKEEILGSGYNELVEKMVDVYGFKEYQIPSALSLLEIHHHYSIFKPGNWVLDIGAGPFYSWTSLALKLTADLNKTHLVISNDLNDSLKKRDNNVLVRGNFCFEPVQTKIALNLQDRLLNTILIDATQEEFSGVPGTDASHTMDVFYSALKFSNRYLQKGGSIIMRTQECVETLANEQKAKFLFNEVYRYKPSNVKANSTNFFYIMKGFMMTPRTEQAQKMLKEYKGTKQNKINVVNKCKQEYDWDPMIVVNNQAKQTISELKQKGHKNSYIFKMYENDPYVKVREIVKLIDTLNDQNANPVEQTKARYKFLYDYDLQNDYNLPETEHQFAHMLIDQFRQITQQLKKNRRKNKHKKGQDVDNQKAPLGEDEIYMRVDEQSQSQAAGEKEYRASDYFGYEIQQMTEKQQMLVKKQSQEELIKILESFTDNTQISQSEKQQVQNLTSDFMLNKDKIKQKINLQDWQQDFQDIEQAFNHAYPETQKQKKIEKMYEEDDDDPILYEDDDKFNESDSSQSKIDFMSSKTAKTNRYVNQRRSIRKNSYKKKF